MTSTTTEWGTATLPEAGFAPDLEERFDVARQAGVLPNLHGVVAARNGRIFFERYLAGVDALGEGRWVSSILDRTRCTICARLRRASSDYSMGSLWPLGWCHRRRRSSSSNSWITQTLALTLQGSASQSAMR